jgi:UDP-N-acetylmuramyl pentapeptide phosphotransferase/UDP-N-acetylglucosamine-1-phosphate transferase
VTVAWLVASVNAWNFMDGIDGLAGGTAVVAGVAWWRIGDVHGARPVAVAGIVLAAAALGFLPLNFPRARVFLGDVGSYYLGALAAAIVVLGVRHDVTPEAMVAPLAVFLADTASTLVRRAGRRERLFDAHREHAYQRLVIAGWSHVRTTAFALAITAACAVAGAATTASTGARVVGDVVVVALLGAYLVTPALVARG